ncbi:pilus assembly protein TadG-related protein [Sphingomonas sp. PL-96]|uniref:pilus assembly protein TadG-related protein n=1 Tax=Sphingomonas sp. PL-96 TaxID=2887201 RepID=UPI001E38EBD6|nr:pilus assembly protein TadG-related protein [Sphingomonas sp. PL-96]MCC2975070.1 pilus assembly protein TadG-related protein [Sphingomonas sp. PL-96]
MGVESGLGWFGACLANLVRDVRGSVSVIGVFALVALVGIAALSIELGQGYRAKLALQGAADAAALGAAHAYAASPTELILNATAEDVARANGLAIGNVSVFHRPNYSSTVPDAVEVQLRTSIPLFFARIFSAETSYGVSVSAVASLPTETTPPCILALANSGGLTLSGGTSLSASHCAVVSNSSISVTGGSTLTAKSTLSSGASSASGGSRLSAETITYGTTVSGVTGKTVRQANSTSDPLASNAALTAAFDRLGMSTTPVMPSGTYEDLTLGYNPTTMTFQGHVGTLTGDNVWHFPAGDYKIRALNVGSLKLVIEGPSTISVSSGVTVGGGGGIAFGDGDVTVKGAMVIGGGANVSFGAGAHVIGSDGAGKAIELGGGSTLSFGDGPFSADGAIVTVGGTTLTFGATANHYINGNLTLAGSSIFGAGTYTINGNFTNGTGGAMTGSNVSFILAGTLNLAGGTSMNVAAPGSNSGTGIADILFATRSTAATVLGGGAQTILSGVVYAPNSDVSMSGGVSASGNCFSLIARTIKIESGPTAATACPTLGSGGLSGSVGLIR